MGYSCAVKANTVMKVLDEQCVKDTGAYNTWLNNGEKYFYEIGRENKDGAITGTVYLLGDGFAYNKGGFKIESDGTIVRFPKLSAVVKKAMLNESRIQQEFAKGSMFVMA